jgi:2,3-bisphosphoglycerate-independent phosphoglycerate mutase
MVQRGKGGRPLPDEDGVPVTKTGHSLEAVPFLIVNFGDRQIRLTGVPASGLANVVSAICELVGFMPPIGYAPSLARVVPATTRPPPRPG